MRVKNHAKIINIFYLLLNPCKKIFICYIESANKIIKLDILDLILGGVVKV